MQPYCPQGPGSDASATPTPPCKKPVFLGFSHFFPAHALGEEALHPHQEGGETLSCSLPQAWPPTAPGWHSTPSLGTAWTLPGAVVCPRGRGGRCLVQDVTFLHRAVVEAPGDTSGMCPEAASPPFALLSCDAGEATVYPEVRIVGTYFRNCVKQKQRKEGGHVTLCSVYLAA